MTSFLRNFSSAGALLVALLAAPLLLCAGQASANAPGPVHGKFMKPQDQPALTTALVEKVLKALPHLIALSKNYQGGHSAGASKKPKVNVKYIAFTKALDKLSVKYGFKNAPTMQRTVEATMLTTGFLKSGKTLKQIDDQMLATQNVIMQNPKLSQVQKNSLLQRMAIQVSMVIPSPENIETVKPFLKRILAITAPK